MKMANVSCVLLMLFALFYANKHIGVAAQCNCPKEHPQTTFCNADFAVFGKVVSENENPPIVTYQLLVKKVLKVSENLKKIVQVNKNLVVISNLTPCASKLVVNDNYYLTGTYDSGNLKFEIDICQLQIKESVINNEQKWGFIRDYEKTCNTCILPNNECPFTPNNLECYSQYAICMSRNAGDPCSWLRMSAQELATCLARFP